MKQINLFDETNATHALKTQPVLASFSIERREFIEALRAIKARPSITKGRLHAQI